MLTSSTTMVRRAAASTSSVLMFPSTVEAGHGPAQPANLVVLSRPSRHGKGHVVQCLGQRPGTKPRLAWPSGTSDHDVPCLVWP